MNIDLPAIRCAILNRTDPFVDGRTGLTPEIMRATAARFEFALFNSTAELFSIGNLTSATLFARSSGGTILFSKTVTAETFRPQLSVDEWNAGTYYHFAFVLTSAEAQIVAGSHELTLTGVTTSDTVPLGQSTLKVTERGLPAVPPPTPSGSYLTADETRSLIAATALNLAPGQTITLSNANGASCQLRCSEAGTLEILNQPAD